MRLNREITVIGWCAALWLAAAGSGCAPPSTVQSSVSSNFHTEDSRPMALLPLRPPARKAAEPIYRNVGVQPEAPALLTRILYDKLKERGTDDLVPMEEVEAALSRAEADLRSGSISRLAAWVGKEVHARAVMAGQVVIYEERRGGPYGVEHPASVGIDLVLIQTATQDTLWKATYYETQVPLSTDIRTFPLYIHRGGKWVRAEDLARYGIEEMVNLLPKAKPVEKR